MSMAHFPIAYAAIAEPAGAVRGERPPVTRLIVPKPDERKLPEAR